MIWRKQACIGIKHPCFGENKHVMAKIYYYRKGVNNKVLITVTEY
jgi:hypothetical protein